MFNFLEKVNSITSSVLESEKPSKKVLTESLTQYINDCVNIESICDPICNYKPKLSKVCKCENIKCFNSIIGSYCLDCGQLFPF